MTFRRSDLQEAFFVPGAYPFRVWGYGTTDPLEEVLAPGYFAPGSALLRPGELIYVSVAPRQGNGPERAEAHLALVMVRADARSPDRADGSARLAPRADHRGRPGAARVQDFGRPGDCSGTLALPTSTAAGAPGVSVTGTPVKRGRGRPRASRTRKPAMTPTGDSLESSPPA